MYSAASYVLSVLAVYCVYVRINLAHFVLFLGNIVCTNYVWKENNVAQHNSILSNSRVHSQNSYSNGFIMHIAEGGT